MCDEDPDPAEPEDLFLIALWDHLEVAGRLSVEAGVMKRLDDIRHHCLAAAEHIRQWQSQSSGSGHKL